MLQNRYHKQPSAFLTEFWPALLYYEIWGVLVSSSGFKAPALTRDWWASTNERRQLWWRRPRRRLMARKGADVLKEKKKLEKSSALQTDALDGENNGLMLISSQAFRTFHPRVEAVKGQ